jgi:hypothetical protein
MFEFSEFIMGMVNKTTLIQLKLCKAGGVPICISCFRPSYVMKNNREQEQTGLNL